MTEHSAATGAGDICNHNYSDEDYRRLHIAHCYTADALRAKDAEIERLTAEIAMWKGLQEGTVAATRAEIERLTKLLERIRRFYHEGIDDRTFAGCVGQVLDEYEPTRAALKEQDHELSERKVTP